MKFMVDARPWSRADGAYVVIEDGLNGRQFTIPAVVFGRLREAIKNGEADHVVVLRVGHIIDDTVGNVPLGTIVTSQRMGLLVKVADAPWVQIKTGGRTAELGGPCRILWLPGEGM